MAFAAARAAPLAGRPVRARCLHATPRARSRAAPDHAAAALIDRAVQNARAALGARPLLILTGGGGQQLRTYIESPVRVVPDLVLRGLAVLARG